MSWKRIWKEEIVGLKKITMSVLPVKLRNVELRNSK
jgi:hypothetical protein